MSFRRSSLLYRHEFTTISTYKLHFEKRRTPTGVWHRHQTRNRQVSNTLFGSGRGRRLKNTDTHGKKQKTLQIFFKIMKSQRIWLNARHLFYTKMYRISLKFPVFFIARTPAVEFKARRKKGSGEVLVSTIAIRRVGTERLMQFRLRIKSKDIAKPNYLRKRMQKWAKAGISFWKANLRIVKLNHPQIETKKQAKKYIIMYIYVVGARFRRRAWTAHESKSSRDPIVCVVTWMEGANLTRG